MTRPLLVMTTWVKPEMRQEIELGLYPRMDYFELSDLLNADILDYNAVLQERNWSIRFLNRFFGIDVALAALTMRKLQDYDVIFTGAERVGIPLAIMMRMSGRKKRHCMLCHLLTTNSKTRLLKLFGLVSSIDLFVCQNAFQANFLKQNLNADPQKVKYIRSVPVDQIFYEPVEAGQDEGIVSVGKELRDYPLLVKAAEEIDIPVHIIISSPWSLRRDQLERSPLPPKVKTSSNHSYTELKEIYAGAQFVAIPLQDVESPAGATALMESMCMGKAAIVTASRGILDFIEHMETGILVKPGDLDELKQAILFLKENPAEAARMGANGRRLVEHGMAMDAYVTRVAEAVTSLRERPSKETVVME